MPPWKCVPPSETSLYPGQPAPWTRTETDLPKHDSRASVLETLLTAQTSPKKLTRVAAPSPRASLGRRTVCGRTEQLSAAGFEALRN